MLNVTGARVPRDPRLALALAMLCDRSFGRRTRPMGSLGEVRRWDKHTVVVNHQDAFLPMYVRAVFDNERETAAFLEQLGAQRTALALPTRSD